MKKHVFIKVLLCVLLFTFCFLTHNGYAAEKVTTLRYTHFMAPDNLQSKSSQEWCKEVEKRTNGRVKVMFYPGGTLIPIVQTYDAVVKGSADIGFGIFTYSRGRFPLTEVIDLPLGYKDGYTASKLINEYYKKFKPKELDDVKVLYLQAHGSGIMHFKKPITKMEELKGMKIRSSGLSAKIVTVLGGTPVSLPITEAYDAISKGIADGMTNDVGGLVLYGLSDLLPYHIENYSSAYTSAFYTVMNKDKWNALSPDDQAIIDKINEEWIEKSAQIWREFDVAGRKAILQKDGKFVKLSKEEDARWAQAVKPILDDYVKTTKEKGLPGDQALKFCIDYLKAYDK